MNSSSDQTRRKYNKVTSVGMGAVTNPKISLGSQKHLEFGQTMVEMAFVLPLFLALVLSIIEFGRAWSTKQSLTLAAREGSRVLVLPYGAGLTFGSEGAKQQAAVETVKSYLNTSGVAVTNDTEIIPVRLLPGGDNIFGNSDDTIEQNYTGGMRGDRIGIQVKHKFETPLAIILSMFDNSQETTGQTDNESSGQSQVNMGVTCYLEHE